MNVHELADYYANLLILQYVGKARAHAMIEALVTPVIMPQMTVETITFSPVPTSGSFTLFYNGIESVPINWNDSAAAIQAKLRGLAQLSIDGGAADTATFDADYDGGDAASTSWVYDFDGGDAYGFDLSMIVVTGSIAAGLITISFVGVTPPAFIFELGDNTLSDGTDTVVPVITETDETLPLAVQNGFNLNGDTTAAGVQLDVIGKYVGVTRYGNGFSTSITLNDADFLSLIRMAIIKNSAGSSLAQIQDFINRFFAGQLYVIDYKSMRMSFLISAAVGSQDLVQLFITEGLLPVPMAVQYSIIYAPVIDHFFGFRTYGGASINVEPFNDYADYQEDWPWLSYADSILPP